MTLEKPKNIKDSARDRILRASLELFVEQGYFNTNIPDVSRLSKCSIGSIYHHFTNKEEIAVEIYKEGIKKFREFLSSVVEKDKSFIETIRAVLPAYMKFAESHRMLSRYLWLARHREFISRDIIKPTVVGFDDLGRKLAVIIKRSIKAGEIQKMPAELIWTIVFGIPQSFITDWLDGFTASTPSEVSDEICAACLRALGAKE